MKKSQLTYIDVALDKFAEIAEQMKKQSATLAAEWASEANSCFEIYACYRQNSNYNIVKTVCPKSNPEFPSLVGTYTVANRFERQIHSLFGIIPIGHPDLRPWIKFEDWPEESYPLRKNVDGLKPLGRVAGEYAWIQSTGVGVCEIPVGPVHAGIIEPGHFRFHAVGETIINLEERFGYTHKGIEKRFETLGWEDGSRLAGRVSGDSTVAHALAYCVAVESMSDINIPKRASWIRALFLERERISNHLGDIGAICNDASFVFLFYQFMRLKEKLLRTNQQLWGHRFMMDLIILGGVSVEVSIEGIDQILSELSMLEKEFEELVKIYDGNPSLEERVLTTGILTKEQAKEFGVVGYVSRASGGKMDCRVSYPIYPYDQIDVRIPTYIDGDVNARIWVRVDEIRESIRIIRFLLNEMPIGELSVVCPKPEPNKTGFSAVEGWRGETLYWVQSDEKGQLNRCMVRDPSSVNWLALEKAVMNNIVADFPLCNKSFNCSYSGHDL
ncbi:MAG: NADH-quinone oxidoreductase subunit C [Candidatus Riflemargulisbacteria bacterium]